MLTQPRQELSQKLFTIAAAAQSLYPRLSDVRLLMLKLSVPLWTSVSRGATSGRPFNALMQRRAPALMPSLRIFDPKV